MALFFFLILVLLSQSPGVAQQERFFVTTSEYKKYDCQTGKKTKSKPLFPSTVVSANGPLTEQLEVRVLTTDETFCIKPKSNEIVEVRPLQLSNGDEAPFPEKRMGILSPELRRRGKGPAIPRVPSLGPSQFRGIETLTVFVVDAEGKVPTCEIGRSSGFEEWDNWACRRVRGLSFSPARKNQAPIAVTMVEFSQTRTVP